jgi:hypothetical protein
LLRVGVPAAGRDGGVEDGGQGLGRVVRVVPVAGQAGGALVGRDERGVGLQRLRVPAVEAGALAGQQVVADGLAHQGVAEAVAVPVGRREQDVGADGGPQRLDEVVLGEPGHGGEQPVLHGGAALGDDPGDPLGRLGQALDADEEQIAQGVGEAGAAALVGGHGQLLDEERVAVGAREDLVDLGRVGFGGEDSGDLTADFGAAETAEFDTADGAQPVEFGEQRAQRVAAVDVVGAVGGDDEEAAAAERAEEVGEEVAGRGVGPVQVLQEDDDRAVGGDALQQAAVSSKRRAMPSSSCRPREVSPSSGSSRASSSSCPAAAAASSSGRWRRRARSALEKGAKGSPSAPISTQPPSATTAPSRQAAVANSSMSRVFPTPASPPSSNACGSPAAARASASFSTSSSSARPTKTGLTDLVSTTPSIAQPSDTTARLPSGPPGFRARTAAGRSPPPRPHLPGGPVRAADGPVAPEVLAVAGRAVTVAPGR